MFDRSGLRREKLVNFNVGFEKKKRSGGATGEGEGGGVAPLGIGWEKKD